MRQFSRHIERREICHTGECNENNFEFRVSGQKYVAVIYTGCEQ